jgi:NAD(P)-dependent dehydrogenase (short-subunit alcohol dehydrogenase family)
MACSRSSLSPAPITLAMVLDHGGRPFPNGHHTGRMSAMGRLDSKAAIITGGEGSIGMATARAFVAEGARVFLAGISEPDLKAGAAELNEGTPGEDAAAWALADVTDSAQVKAAVDVAVERFGRLDIVVANAGVTGTSAPVADYPEEDFDHVLAVHVRGAFLLCKHAVPHLSAGASVIITSSVVGLTGAPGIAGYATAKHAQVGLMRTMAAELAPKGIRVNTIHPGPVDNAFQARVEVTATGADAARAQAIFDGLIPLARHARPGEIARSMLFLASDDSSFMTGATLAVDGGMSS